MKTCAEYTLAASYAYMRNLKRSATSLRSIGLPNGVTSTDLNFCNQASTLFHVDTVLLSFNQFGGKSRQQYVHPHDVSNATVLVDSGGYAVIDNPRFWQERKTMRDSLEFFETTGDVAMTLDIPTRCVTIPRHPFSTQQKCLDASLESYAFFRDNRRNESLKLLTVLQGNTPEGASKWYHAVKKFNFEGYAHGGPQKLNFEVWLPVYRQMLESGAIANVQRIHFLGVAALEPAVLMTAFARALEKAAGRHIPVTYDSTTPCTQAFRYFNAFTRPHFAGSGASLNSARLPRGRKYVGSDRPFPYQTSAIAKRLNCGDLCPGYSPQKLHAWDDLSCMLAANHNFDVLLQAIDEANRLYDLEREEARQHFPDRLLRTCGVIEEYFQSDKPGQLIKKNRDVLRQYARSFQDDEREEDCESSDNAAPR